MTENEKRLNGLIDTLIDLVDTIEYSDIVSHERFLEFDTAGAEIIGCIEDLKEYRTIGTIEELQALKEKNEPKKLNNSLEEDGKIGGYCPNCNGTVLIRKTFLRISKGKCCDWCGQKLDFGKEE